MLRGFIPIVEKQIQLSIFILTEQASQHHFNLIKIFITDVDIVVLLYEYFLLISLDNILLLSVSNRFYSLFSKNIFWSVTPSFFFRFFSTSKFFEIFGHFFSNFLVIFWIGIFWSFFFSTFWSFFFQLFGHFFFTWHIYNYI